MSSSPWMISKKQFINLKNKLIQKFKRCPESKEYRVWRDRFLRERLKLCVYICIPCIVTFFVCEKISLEIIPHNLVEAYIARLVFIFIGIAFYHTSWGKRNPKYLLLWASGSITILPDLWMMARSLPTSSVIAINMVFVIQTTLLPVYWKIHAVSQVIRIIAGLSTLFLLEGSLDSLSKLHSPLLYWLWLYVVCILAVYLYERLQQQEFEARRALNIFLYTVSGDLRTPVAKTSILLNNLLAQTKEDGSIFVDRTTLEDLLARSNRQLNTINSLLEARRISQDKK